MHGGLPSDGQMLFYSHPNVKMQRFAVGLVAEDPSTSIAESKHCGCTTLYCEVANALPPCDMLHRAQRTIRPPEFFVLRFGKAHA